MFFLFQGAKNESREEHIELSKMENSEPELMENEKKSTNGCLGFLKKSKI